MIAKEAIIFLIVGLLTVAIDFLSYQALLFVELWRPASKALGFIAGTLFSYFANRYWTFGHKGDSLSGAKKFVLLYAVTLLANVLINQIVLGMMTGLVNASALAFIVATGFSAILNFLGMKYYVFIRKE